MKGYKELIVWQKSMNLVFLVYELTSKFPRNEVFGLTSQMKRASISIPSNLAEGSRRKYGKEQNFFFRIAYGSATELETQLEISKMLKLTNQISYEKTDLLLTEILKMLSRMVKY